MFTDGACRGNPGPGGWGVLLRMGNKEKELSGGEALTTNNRMELLAAIKGLEALKKPCRVDLHTDSIYVRDGITRWIHNWQRNGWRTSNKKPVKNIDLWQQLDALAAKHRVRWHWVRGHAGHALAIGVPCACDGCDINYDRQSEPQPVKALNRTGAAALKPYINQRGKGQEEKAQTRQDKGAAEHGGPCHGAGYPKH